MPGNFAALEAARLARDPRDLTRAASVEAPRTFKMGASVVHVDNRTRLVSDDGLRFEFARTEGASRNGQKLPRRDTLGRRITTGGGGPGRGAAGWSPEKRKRISARANAARWGK